MLHGLRRVGLGALLFATIVDAVTKPGLSLPGGLNRTMMVGSIDAPCGHHHGAGRIRHPADTDIRGR